MASPLFCSPTIISHLTLIRFLHNLYRKNNTTQFVSVKIKFWKISIYSVLLECNAGYISLSWAGQFIYTNTSSISQNNQTDYSNVHHITQPYHLVLDMYLRRSKTLQIKLEINEHNSYLIKHQCTSARTNWLSQFVH